MRNHLKSEIKSIHAYIPQHVITNKDLEILTGVNSEMIFESTGLLERRYSIDDIAPTDMGVKAALKVFEETNIPKSSIDMIISSSSSRDQAIPTDSMVYAHKLGIPRVRCLDLDATCASYLYALEISDLYIKTWMLENILILCSEKPSGVLNYKDPSSSIIFGDSAAATLISRSQGNSMINYSYFETNAIGDAINLVEIKGGGIKHNPNDPKTTPEMNQFKMKGKKIYKLALKHIPILFEILLKGANLNIEDIDFIIPHQVNPRTLMAILKKTTRDYEFPIEKVYVDKIIGNSAAATFPVAMAELVASDKILRGDRIMLIGAAVGFTVCGIILTY
jgi:3-oxoacyl-[acyl-carrier-protein] synthase-3